MKKSSVIIPKFRSLLFVLTFIYTIAFGGSPASAGNITGGTSNWNEYTPYNVSSGSNAWTIWGGVGTFGNGTDLTYGEYSTGSGSAFGAQSSTQGTVFGNYLGFGGRIKYNYTNGLGSYPGTVSGSVGESDSTVPKYESDSNVGAAVSANVSVTHLLLGNVEDLTFMVAGTNVAALNWNASLNSGGSYSSSQLFSDSQGNNFALITLHVTGSTGDLLTFTLAQDAPVDPSGGFNQAGVGISSAQASVVPEPSTWALLAVGAFGLAVLRRRQKSVA